MAQDWILKRCIVCGKNRDEEGTQGRMYKDSAAIERPDLRGQVMTAPNWEDVAWHLVDEFSGETLAKLIAEQLQKAYDKGREDARISATSALRALEQRDGKPSWATVRYAIAQLRDVCR